SAIWAWASPHFTVADASLALWVARAPVGPLGGIGGEWGAAQIDKQAILWKAATGERLHPLPQHQDRVQATTFSPDGRFVLLGYAADLAGQKGGTVQVWEAAT